LLEAHKRYFLADAAAISLNKRAAANVEACVVNINTVSTQLDILNPSVSSAFSSLYATSQSNLPSHPLLNYY
jgi:hypothetical protein